MHRAFVQTAHFIYGTSHKKTTDFWRQPLPTAAAVSPFCFAEYTSINFEMAEFIN